MSSSQRRGDTAEAAVLHALVARGHTVLLPFGQSQPYDLVIHMGGMRFLRVQCKSARFDRGRALFNGYGTDHGKGITSYRGLADLYGVHFGPCDAVYLVPVNEVVAHHGRLRIEPARNHQRVRVRVAADYEIDRWTEERLVTLASGPAVSSITARLPRCHA